MIYSKTITVNYAVVKDHLAIGKMKHNGAFVAWYRQKKSVLEQNLSHGHKPKKIDKYITSDNVENYLTVRPNNW